VNVSGEIKTTPIVFVSADLSLMKNAEALFDKEPELLAFAKMATHIVFTLGVVSTPTRLVTAEGIEKDMAISFLSRFVLMQRLGKLKTEGALDPSLRITIVGFPGASNEIKDIDDLNAEKEYKIFSQHLKTAVANEVMTIQYATTFKTIGINPGLIVTDIRSSLELGTIGRVLEGFIGLTRPTAAQYADSLVRLLFAPELDASEVTGVSFTPKMLQLMPGSWCTAENMALLMPKLHELAAKGLSA